MIAGAGFVVESARHDLVTLRRRGAPTDLPANT
jgi:hypothetical protein